MIGGRGKQKTGRCNIYEFNRTKRGGEVIPVLTTLNVRPCYHPCDNSYPSFS